MSIGTSVPLPAYIDPAFMAQKAEELGFESIWYAEHPAVPVHSTSPFPATGGEIPGPIPISPILTLPWPELPGHQDH